MKYNRDDISSIIENHFSRCQYFFYVNKGEDFLNIIPPGRKLQWRSMLWVAWRFWHRAELLLAKSSERFELWLLWAGTEQNSTVTALDLSGLSIQTKAQFSLLPTTNTHWPQLRKKLFSAVFVQNLSDSWNILNIYDALCRTAPIFYRT